ncbi:MAG TPA: hypothetical protein VF483_06120 [Gemmatimonadaceae bacterium]
MNPDTRRRVGNVVLIVGIAVLLVNLAGMSGLIPKVATARELNLVALVLIIAAGGMRRRGRTPSA